MGINQKDRGASSEGPPLALRPLKTEINNKSNKLEPMNEPEKHTAKNEGNGTPLQYSCLENPTDGGAW